MPTWPVMLAGPAAGMVLTDLLLKDSNPVARRFFNALVSRRRVADTFELPGSPCWFIKLLCCAL